MLTDGKICNVCIKMDSGAMAYIQSFMKIGSVIQKLIGMIADGMEMA
jgi:hypothetical protein